MPATTARNCGRVRGKLEGSKITVDNDFLITRLVGGGESSLKHDGRGRKGRGNVGGIGYGASTARSFPFPTI